MKSLSSVILSAIIMLSSSAFAAQHNVQIQGMKFSPANLNVAVGDTVVFTNMDGMPHTGTANNKSFDTGILNQGQSGTVTIAKTGVLAYFCAVHPSMKGQMTAK